MKSTLLLVAALVCALGIVGRVVFASDGLPTLTRLRAERERMERTNTEIRERNELLRAQIERLRAGGDALEQVARQTLGYVRPDEVIYRFPDRSPEGDGGAR